MKNKEKKNPKINSHANKDKNKILKTELPEAIDWLVFLSADGIPIP